MILLPAVDIRDGRAVRLQQGDFARETVYGEDPVEAARDFGVAGARALHVVDLDGARDGEPANLGHAERIVRELGLPVQYGGGLRSLHSINRALGAGVERVILGTAALTDVDFLEQALGDFRDQVAVGVDVRSGRVAVKGWTEDAAGARADAGRAGRPGVQRVVYTRSSATGCSRARTSPKSSACAPRSPARSCTRAASVRWTTCAGWWVGSVEPGRRDLRQGAVRGTVRRGRGPGGGLG